MENKYIWEHLKTVLKHKKYVFKYCCEAELYWRGIKHDLSKFSPTEFLESIKYYTGVSSPIDKSKKINGYSKAWLHHKGRNTHHYEYWQDNFDEGGEALIMPLEDATELVCDYLGAARVYSLYSSFDLNKVWQYWVDKNLNDIAMHPQTKIFVTLMLYTMKKFRKTESILKCAKFYYNLAGKLYQEGVKVDLCTKSGQMEVANIIQERGLIH